MVMTSVNAYHWSIIQRIIIRALWYVCQKYLLLVLI